MRRSLISVVLVLGAAICVAAPVYARSTSSTGNTPSPEQIAAEAIYTENIPTSSGSQRVGQSSAVGQPTLLPLKSQRALRRIGGRKASLLTAVATASALGAPTATTKGVAPAGGHFSDSGTPSLWSAFGTALNGSDGAALSMLLAAIVLTSALCVAWAVRGRGRRALAEPRHRS